VAEIKSRNEKGKERAQTFEEHMIHTVARSSEVQDAVFHYDLLRGLRMADDESFSPQQTKGNIR
jgi:hypothetical protein